MKKKSPSVKRSKSGDGAEELIGILIETQCKLAEMSAAALQSEQKFRVALLALRDVMNPIDRIMRDVPGIKLKGQEIAVVLGNPQTYRDIAQDALQRLEAA